MVRFVLILFLPMVVLSSCALTYVTWLTEEETMRVEIYQLTDKDFDNGRLERSEIVMNYDSTERGWIKYEITDLDSAQDYLPWCSPNDVLFEKQSDAFTVRFIPSPRNVDSLCYETVLYINFGRKVRCQGPKTKRAKYLKRNHGYILIPMEALDSVQVHYYYLDGTP